MVFEIRVQRSQHAAVGCVVDVAQRQRVAQRVRQGADADLQRAAVAHQRAGVQADRVFRIAHRLPRQREQLRVRRGRGDDDVEEVQRYRRGAAEPWQQRVDLGYQQRAWQTGGDDGVDGVKGQVGIGRQRQLRALRRSEEHTSELQSLMRISYAVFGLKKKKQTRKY